MLDAYKEKQSVAFNVMMNEITNNNISHAYLIDENNNSESFEIVMAFIKQILCQGLDSNSAAILCKRINDGNYPEIKIVEPDGMLIKKQQILDLQKAFSMAAVEGNKQIYIIRDADKMRSETANSMLKFLEEPDNNVIAILMTNNYNNLLPTIVSRCQVIRLNKDEHKQNNIELEMIVLNFIYEVETYGIKAIVNEQELLFNNINLKERDKYISFYDKMIDMYYDILKILSGSNKIVFSDYYDKLYDVAKKNNLDGILKKINLLLSMKDTIKNNVNINLLIDNLIIQVGGM